MVLWPQRIFKSFADDFRKWRCNLDCGYSVSLSILFFSKMLITKKSKPTTKKKIPPSPRKNFKRAILKTFVSNAKFNK